MKGVAMTTEGGQGFIIGWLKHDYLEFTREDPLVIKLASSINSEEDLHKLIILLAAKSTRLSTEIFTPEEEISKVMEKEIDRAYESLERYMKEN